VVYGSYLTQDVAVPAREAHQRSRDFLSLNVPYSIRGNANPASLRRCEDTVARAFQVLPAEHVKAVRSLTLSFDPTMRRGLAGGNTLILRCVNMSVEETTAVLIHEVGHVVDTGLLGRSLYGEKTTFVDRGKTVYSSDPSVALYGVSWKNNSSFTGRTRDFVSGYAMENPYEEFAETYAMYVLHGPLFRFQAAHNRALNDKYEFMRDVVFEDTEFNFTSDALPPILQVMDRHYDTTRLDYDLESFLTLLESSDS
jgi:hypothetical protein